MRIQLIVAENDSGHWGARMGQGPGHLLAGGMVERLQAAGHITETIRVAPRDSFPAEIASAFRTAAEVSRQVNSAVRQRRFPVVLAGNCFASLGVVAGHRQDGRALVWFDAHADLQTPETTESGFLDGMALATILGRAWSGMSASIPGFAPVPAERVLLVGARALDRAEEDALKRWRLPAVPLQVLAEQPDALQAAAAALSRQGDRVHLHVDLDVLDPSAAAPANPFTPAGGLAPDALLEMVASLRARLPLASLTLCSYDPSLDPGGVVRDTAIAVAEAAVA